MGGNRWKREGIEVNERNGNERNERKWKETMEMQGYVWKRREIESSERNRTNLKGKARTLSQNGGDQRYSGENRRRKYQISLKWVLPPD